MGGKKENKVLRELFSKRLENAEVIPSPESEAALFRKLWRKEFLRFNTSRFNIWYAGAIAAAGAAALMIYLAGDKNDNSELPASPVREIKVADESGQAAQQDVNSERNLDYLNVCLSLPEDEDHNVECGKLVEVLLEGIADNMDLAPLSLEEWIKTVRLYFTEEEKRLEEILLGVQTAKSILEERLEIRIYAPSEKEFGERS